MKVAIIGGNGQMGRWFSRFFMKKRYEVIISGRKRRKKVARYGESGVKVAKTSADAVKGADLVIISVMPKDFKSVVKEIAPYVEKNQKIIDISSVKEEPVRIMHKYLKSANILGTHPMFGPNADAAGQNFILTPTNAKERRFANEFGRFLRKSGFNVKETTPKIHDHRISVVLSLTHFVGFVTADTWRELEVHKFTSMSSTSFKFLKQFVKSIVDSSPELYSYLQMNVENVPNAEKEFALRSKAWTDLVKNKRKKEFMKKMIELRKYINSIE